MAGTVEQAQHTLLYWALNKLRVPAKFPVSSRKWKLWRMGS